jgi:hypothetical protein
LHASNDNAVSGGDALGDDPVGANLRAYLDILNYYFVIGADDRRLESALKFCDRCLGSKHSILM